MIDAKAVRIVPNDASRVESLAVLSRFRTDFYACLTARVDALFELTDAVLCTDGPVRTLVGLSLAPEHRRGHGAMYDVEAGQREAAAGTRPLRASRVWADSQSNRSAWDFR